MPTAPLSACLSPRCPGFAVSRGYCEQHKPTTTQRGGGSLHQRERASALAGARCERCGSIERLERDHRLPRSLGGSDSDPANKRWLCRPCHSAIGLRRDTPVAS